MERRTKFTYSLSSIPVELHLAAFYDLARRSLPFLQSAYIKSWASDCLTRPHELPENPASHPHPLLRWMCLPQHERRKTRRKRQPSHLELLLVNTAASFHTGLAQLGASRKDQMARLRWMERLRSEVFLQEVLKGADPHKVETSRIDYLAGGDPLPHRMVIPQSERSAVRRQLLE